MKRTLASRSASICARRLLGRPASPAPRNRRPKSRTKCCCIGCSRCTASSDADDAGGSARSSTLRFHRPGQPRHHRAPATPEQCRDSCATPAVALRASPSSSGSAAPATWRRCTTRASKRAEDARACIDQFEFPDIPCEYPVVWVRAREAAQICEAHGQAPVRRARVGGRLRGQPRAAGLPLRPGPGRKPGLGGRAACARPTTRPTRPTSAGATARPTRRASAPPASQQDRGLPGRRLERAAARTPIPAGYFPECRSPLGVYDLNGNAAEHMNLPLDESQMASRGSRELGVTEMKGSWFIFDTLPGPRGLVPLARAVLARQPGDGRAAATRTTTSASAAARRSGGTRLGSVARVLLV